MAPKVKKTDAEWRQELRLKQFEVTRKEGTDAPFSGEYNKNYEEGV